MKSTVLSVVFGSAALAAGVLCHRYAPGLGLVVMPMFWPLAALSAFVPARHAVITAAIVPFVSFALTGMPALPMLVSVKFALLTAFCAWMLRRLPLFRK